MTLSATGTYTILMQHDGNSTGSLTFQLYNVPPDATGTIAIGGPTATLTTTVPGQNGSLTFSGTAGQKINVATSQNMTGWFFLSVLNPDGTALYGPTENAGTPTVGPLILPLMGTYTIRLRHDGSGTGSLTFAFTGAP